MRTPIRMLMKWMRCMCIPISTKAQRLSKTWMATWMEETMMRNLTHLASTSSCRSSNKTHRGSKSLNLSMAVARRATSLTRATPPVQRSPRINIINQLHPASSISFLKRGMMAGFLFISQARSSKLDSYSPKIYKKPSK
jgi:hypothetical protein